MTGEWQREEKVTDALLALPRDLRRDPYGYELSRDDLRGWACFMVAHFDENSRGGYTFDREVLAGCMADDNIADLYDTGNKKVASGYDELAEESHFLHWVEAMTTVLR